MKTTRVREPNELTEKEINEIFEYAREASFLSDEELDAIEHITPMTQELFERCSCAMIENDAFSGFCRLNKEYPELTRVYANKIEKRLDQIDIPEESPEELGVRWEQLCDRIKEVCGDNII